MSDLGVSLNFGLFRAGCIYGLECPDTGLIRYIGKTFNPKKRFLEHFNAKSNKTTKKDKWICKLLINGKRPNIVVIDTCDEFDWQEKEIAYIKLYKSFGANLLNHTQGGEQGALNFSPNISARQKISEKLKGKPKTKEHTEKAVLAKMKRMESDKEFKDKIVNLAKSRLENLTEEQKQKAKAKRLIGQSRRFIVKLCDLYKVHSRIKNKQITRIDAAKELGCNRDNIYNAYRKYTNYIKT